MRARNPFLGVAVALSTATVVASAALSVPLAEAQGPVSPPSGKGKTAEEIESYWTPERMRNAKPAPMPQPDAAKGKTVAPDKRPADAKPGATPGARPKAGEQ